MKKFSKIIFGVAMSALMVFGLVACTPKSTGTAKAYGLVHNHYVGVATVKTVNGKIDSVVFDEMEMPYSWAMIDNISTAIVEADQAINEEFPRGETEDSEGKPIADPRVKYAKKIKIGDTTFTARDNGATSNYVDYTSDKNGATKLEDWVKVDANAQWYFEQMAAGNYDILKDDGTAYSAEWKAATSSEAIANLTKSNRWLKSANGYWAQSKNEAGEVTRKGWKYNMKAMQDYLKGTDFTAYKGDEVKDGTFKIGGVDTGATLNDFHDYMGIAKVAYTKAIAIEEESKKDK